MRAAWLAALIIAPAACSSSGSTDIHGPFTGSPQRYAIDQITLPTLNTQVDELGDDLDGDGKVDNQLGVVLIGLTATGDATSHGTDLVAAGAISSSIELQADALDRDPTAGARYFGFDDDAPPQLGGALVAGAYASNRTRTTKLDATATIVIPGFADADPLALPLHGMELDLTPDGTGFAGLVRGAVPLDEARTIAATGVVQMMVDHPTGHLPFSRTIDTNHDGMVTVDEVATSALFQAFLVGDVTLFGQPMLSVGFAVHVVPCDQGRCSTAQPGDACHDRVLDGNETAVDCGGSCAACPAAAACSVPADCESGACDSGHCRAPTCADHVRDAFESDVDCGAACPACAAGKACANNADCASGHCGTGSGPGTCS